MKCLGMAVHFLRLLPTEPNSLVTVSSFRVIPHLMRDRNAMGFVCLMAGGPRHFGLIQSTAKIKASHPLSVCYVKAGLNHRLKRGKGSS